MLTGVRRFLGNKWSFSMLSVLITVILTSCGVEKPMDVELAEKEIPKKVDFNFHVKPILSDRCFSCHGPDEANQKAGLRLDLKKAAYALLESGEGHAIVPHKAGKSLLVDRILSNDTSFMMPPPESNLSLSAKEKAILIRWIEQGAEYKPHWSFITPEKPELPEVNNIDWVNNEIDHFILKALEHRGIEPSSRTKKEILIRRVTMDITGLPPTLEEIDAFLEDDGEDAYEQVVNRLLKSPAYGERMASPWLDAARYADSEGYLDDFHRRMWPWRDWVIKAFNKNLPYDKFLLWQIAGDQIPNPTKESLLATAFNRNHKHNSEGGIIPEEFRVENVADRTNTLGSAMLGLTMECARCHDHKYDPISQKDYYKLFAFFNSVEERGDGIFGNKEIDPGPTMALTTERTDSIVAYLNDKITDQENMLADLRQHGKSFQRWSQYNRSPQSVIQIIDQKKVARFPFDRVVNGVTPNLVQPQNPGKVKVHTLTEGKFGKALKIGDMGHFLIDDYQYSYERTEPFSLSFWIYLPRHYEDAHILYNGNHRIQGYRGYDVILEDNRPAFRLSHAWPYQSLHIRAKDSLRTNTWYQIGCTYDGSSNAGGMRIYVNGMEAEHEVVVNRLTNSIMPLQSVEVYLPYEGFRIGYRHYDLDLQKGLIDELQIFNDKLTTLEMQAVFNSMRVPTIYMASSDPKTGSLDDDTEEMWREFYDYNINPDLLPVRADLLTLRNRAFKAIDSVERIMVMGDLPEPRKTFVLERGVYNEYGEEVKPGTPDRIMPFKAGYPKNRYGLGLWLTDPEHPLTSRVAVNQIWQMLFGTGIVATSFDFGNQGDLPTHPELLDWLAVYFVESGWDVKALVKKIVMSATYQQSSRIRDDLKDIDPENKLLARAPRYRWPAEVVRDNALAASGLLVNKIGGPGVYPYQPDGLWKQMSTHPWRPEYKESNGSGLYRRSVYTIWKRNVPPPSMLIFDAPDRGVCVIKRRNTNTPLQALVLLNDPQYVEASRVMAENLIGENPTDRTGQIEMAFRLLTSRAPNQEEITVLQELYDKKYKQFEDEEKARTYLNMGKRQLERELPVSKVAALTVVCSAILNTTEAYYKN